MDEKTGKECLKQIYDSFESAAAPFRQGAVCRAGCAFCCTFAGSIDITTIEGLVIAERIERLSGPLRKQVRKKLTRNKKDQERGQAGRCPFLRANDTCLIYEDRPFSCRRLYSVKQCDNSGPTLHRQVVELSREYIEKIQRLDDNGYSGHISYILFMLDTPQFRRTYLAGDFNPGSIMAFGRTHKITINRFVFEPSLQPSISV